MHHSGASPRAGPLPPTTTRAKPGPKNLLWLLVWPNLRGVFVSHFNHLGPLERHGRLGNQGKSPRKKPYTKALSGSEAFLGSFWAQNRQNGLLQATGRTKGDRTKCNISVFIWAPNGPNLTSHLKLRRIPSGTSRQRVKTPKTLQKSAKGLQCLFCRFQQLMAFLLINR
ncbi:MAG: hypothetical protein CM15mP120_11290 [Pseudomonadota bacterium]|nr:MAG: hypothetical protein CM15mP120_11290 [Pseudomonadota bacterium]